MKKITTFFTITTGMATVFDAPRCLAAGENFIAENQAGIMCIEHSVEVVLGLIVGLCVLGVIFNYLFCKRKLLKLSKQLLLSFPGRVGVCDENEVILLLHEYGKRFVNYKTLKEIPHLSYEKVSSEIKSVFATGEVAIFEYENQNVMRAMMVAPFPNTIWGKRCVVWFSYPNDEVQLIRRAAEHLAEQLRLTLESIGDAVMVTDQNGCITMLNPVAERLIGYCRSEAIGKKPDDVFRLVSYLDNTPVSSPLQAALKTGEIFTLVNHTDLIVRDGTRRHIADSAAPICDHDGNITGGILIFRDVTEEYDKRDRLQNAYATLKLGAKLTASAPFQLDLQTRKIVFQNTINEAWPTQNEQVVCPQDFVYPPDLQEYLLRFQQIDSGECNENEWNYRAVVNNKIHYFRMLGKVIRNFPDAPYMIGVIQDVTDITRNAMRLKAVTELWELVINTMPMMLFVKNVDDDFRYIVANRSFAAFTGHPISEIIGQTDFEVFNHPEASAKFRAKDEEIIRSGFCQEFIETPCDAQGNIRHLRTTKVPFQNEDGDQLLLGMVMDMTDLYAYSENEKIVNRCLELFFHNDDAALAIEQILEVICLHTKASRAYMLQFDMDTKLTSCVCEYVASGGNKILIDYAAQPFHDDEPWVQKFLRREYLFLPDCTMPNAIDLLGSWGQYVIMAGINSLYATGLYVKGKLWGDLGLTYEGQPMPPEQFNSSFLETIQHLLEMLLERKQTQEQIILALQAARAADRAKSYFIATVSHEIRTPLNAVIGLSELLRDTALDDDTRLDYLNCIASSGNALLQLINGVLDLSKMEAGQMKIEAQKMDFCILCEEVIASFCFHAQRKKITLNCDISPMPMMSLDVLRIRQILFNLIGNAVKFTEKGRVDVSAEFVQDNSETGTLFLYVRDTGCGIAPEEQVTLFEPFVQAGSVRGAFSSGTGTGLGLAISKRLLESMGGNISLQSELGNGSCFIVELHKVPYHYHSNITQTVCTEGRKHVMRKLNVLIVDDVPMNVKVLQAMLLKCGCIVHCAESAAEALALLDSNLEIDLLLTDLWMPEKNGVELAHEIRERWPDRCRTMKMMAVSADTESNSNFSMEIFDGTLTKPLSMEMVKNMLVQTTI